MSDVNVSMSEISVDRQYQDNESTGSTVAQAPPHGATQCVQSSLALVMDLLPPVCTHLHTDDAAAGDVSVSLTDHCGTGCRCCDPAVESHVVRVVGQTFVVTLRVWELCQTHTSGPASDSRNKLQHLELSSGLTSDDLLALGQPFF